MRDAVKKRDMNEMAITASASDAVDSEVTAKLRELITESGVPVECRDVSLGRANPPDAIKNQRIATAEQISAKRPKPRAPWPTMRIATPLA